MWRMDFRQDPRFRQWYQRIDRQPGWVVKASILAAVLVVVVPLVVLTLAALAVALAVFVVGGLIAAILCLLGRLFGGLRPLAADVRLRHVNDGRRNVRIIDPP